MTTKGKSLKGRHLIITRRASILILIITILICRNLWRRRWRGSESTKASLPSCYTTDTGVHLTHLIGERVKVSIHVLNCAIMASKVTPVVKEGVEVEEAKMEGAIRST